MGLWKNFEDMEDSLTLDELEAILVASRKKEERDRAFAAALQGVDLSEGSDEGTPSFEDIKQRAAAKASELTTEEFNFSQFSIGYSEG